MGLAVTLADSILFAAAEVVAMVTSFTTFLGFVATTLITWRKDHASIELEKKQLELEKLRREIGDRNSAAQKKKKMTKRRWVG